MCSLSEMDLFLMTGTASSPAELILRAGKGRESIRLIKAAWAKVTGARIHFISEGESRTFSPSFLMGLTIIAG